MLERYANCPVCKKKTVLKVPEDVLKDAKRFPYMIKVKHKNHYFYINIDSQAMITDILAPDMVE